MVREHKRIHLFVFVVFAVVAVILSQVPNRHAWDRYIDSKKKNHEIEPKEGPLDKKGEDIYYASLAFAILSLLTGALWTYMHGGEVKDVILKKYKEMRTQPPQNKI